MCAHLHPHASRWHAALSRYRILVLYSMHVCVCIFVRVADMRTHAARGHVPHTARRCRIRGRSLEGEQNSSVLSPLLLQLCCHTSHEDICLGSCCRVLRTISCFRLVRMRCASWSEAGFGVLLVQLSVELAYSHLYPVVGNEMHFPVRSWY